MFLGRKSRLNFEPGSSSKALTTEDTEDHRGRTSARAEQLHEKAEVRVQRYLSAIFHISKRIML